MGYKVFFKSQNPIAISTTGLILKGARYISVVNMIMLVKLIFYSAYIYPKQIQPPQRSEANNFCINKIIDF